MGGHNRLQTGRSELMTITHLRTESARIWFRLGFASYQVKTRARAAIREVPLGFHEVIPRWCWKPFQDEAKIGPNWAKIAPRWGQKQTSSEITERIEAPRTPLGGSWGILEILGGALAALERVSQALGGVLEAKTCQASAKMGQDLPTSKFPR